MAIKYGLKEVADLTIYDIATDKPIMYLDTLKVTTIENTAEQSFARGGKGNGKLLSWDFNREATMTISDALITMKGLSMFTGNATKTGIRNVYEREVLTAATDASNTAVTLSNPMVGTVVTAFKIEDDGKGLAPLATVSATGTKVSFTTANVPAGTEVVVYYQYATAATAETITISADKFPPFVKLVGDTVIRNSVTGIDEAFQFIIHKAKILPNFTLTMQADGDPTVFDMNVDIYRRDVNSDMIEFIKY